MDSLLWKLFEGDDALFYARMAAHGGELIVDEDFVDCYSAGQGRPSIPASLLMKTVLLQLRDDVSDREAARRAAKDLDWKRALGLEADEVPFHHTSLSVFRSRAQRRSHGCASASGDRGGRVRGVGRGAGA